MLRGKEKKALLCRSEALQKECGQSVIKFDHSVDTVNILGEGKNFIAGISSAVKHKTGLCQKKVAMSGEAAGGNDKTELECRGWGSCPHDLLEKVLLQDPSQTLSILSRLRLVSLQWNAVVKSLVHRAPHEAIPAPPKQPVLLYWGPREAKSQDPTQWLQSFHLSESSPSQVWNAAFQHRPASFPAPTLEDRVDLIASEGGLLFFACSTRKESILKDFFVCNPLLGRTKRLLLPLASLPPKASIRSRAVECTGVEVNSKSKSYKLLVSCRLVYATEQVSEAVSRASSQSNEVRSAMPCNVESLSTLVYSSASSTWTNCALPPAWPALIGFERRSVCVDGNLYWSGRYSTVSPSGERVLSDCVLKYNLENNVWTRFEVPFDRNMRHRCIASLAGLVSFSCVAICHDPNGLRYDSRSWRSQDLPGHGAGPRSLSYRAMNRFERYAPERGLETVKSCLIDEYFTFTVGHFCIHVIPEVFKNTSSAKKKSALRITIHNVTNNVYTTLEWGPLCSRDNVYMPLEWDPLRPRALMDSRNVFAFIPSLTFLP